MSNNSDVLDFLEEVQKTVNIIINSYYKQRFIGKWFYK